MENIAYIYKKQLIATGKFYIGKHNGKNKNYKGSGVDWKKDYKLYVKNPKLDIITEIIEWVDNIENINKREVYWLEFYDAANNPLFYNKTNKAKGINKFSREVVDKRAKKLIGTKRSDETKMKMSISKKGKKTSNKTKNIMSKSSPKRKKIIQYDLEGNFIKVWECMSDAARFYNVSTGDLTCCCKEKQLTVKKHIWKYYEENFKIKITPRLPITKSEEFKDNLRKKLTGKKRTEKQKCHRYKPIIQYDKSGNLVNEYKSIREACLQFNKNIESIESGIGACCSGKQKTAYGFIWKYK